MASVIQDKLFGKATLSKMSIESGSQEVLSSEVQSSPQKKDGSRLTINQSHSAMELSKLGNRLNSVENLNNRPMITPYQDQLPTNKYKHKVTNTTTSKTHKNGMPSSSRSNSLKRLT